MGNIAKALQIMQLIIGLAPLIWQAVSKIEDIISEAKRGSFKKDLIMSVLDTAFEVAGSFINVHDLKEPVTNAISKIIDATVSVFNAIGYFKKAQPKPVTLDMTSVSSSGGGK